MESAPVALAVEGVGKTYRLWATPASRLWVPLCYRLAGMLPFPGLVARLVARMLNRTVDRRLRDLGQDPYQRHPSAP